MARKRKDKDEGSEKSEEFKAFEDLAKKVLGVSKSELDKREAVNLVARTQRRNND